MRIASVEVTNQVDSLEEAVAGLVPRVPSPEESILAAIAYADLFDYPLTEAQVVRFQVGTAYSSEEIARTLVSLSVDGGPICRNAEYYTLPGREFLVQIRSERERLSKSLWRRAQLRANWMERTPFVRMVAVTGALSMDNITGKPDIDLLVLTEPGRVWICRRMLIIQVRLARLLGDDLCPNYILSTRNLELDQRDFFTAHELAQMVPLCGHALHSEMLARNSWASRFLPAAFQESGEKLRRARPVTPSRLLEGILASRFFDRWETWELRRLRRKLVRLIGKAVEVVCSPEQCKGHTGLHRSSVMARYGDRLKQLDIYEPFAHLLDADLISRHTDAENP